MSVEIVISWLDGDMDLNWTCSNMDFAFIRDAVFDANPGLTMEQRARFEYTHLLDLSDPKDHEWARSVLANARQWIIDFARQKEMEGKPPSERLRYLIDDIANVEAYLDGVDRRETEPRA